MHRLRGFTLIELLIVIAVIAILVGITVPRFLGMRDEANNAKASGETAALKAAVEAYRIHKDKFPTVAPAWQSELTAIKPQLIESPLLDPFTTSDPKVEYLYKLSANNKYYVIYSVGVDGLADIVSICNTGELTPAASDGNDDVFATNGSGVKVATCP